MKDKPEKVAVVTGALPVNTARIIADSGFQVVECSDESVLELSQLSDQKMKELAKEFEKPVVQKRPKLKGRNRREW